MSSSRPPEAERRATTSTASPAVAERRPRRQLPTPELGSAPTGPTIVAQVVDVTDGDTIRVEVDGETFTVRYIGMDTPETVDPTEPVEWMGREASAANARLVEGETVCLRSDVSETDRFGRILRYVWREDGDGWLLVNIEFVRLGFARPSTFAPDVKYEGLFRNAAQDARMADAGLWGQSPVASPTATRAASPVPRAATPAPVVVAPVVVAPLVVAPVVVAPVAPPPPPPAPVAACHPSYADACLDPTAFDYDCASGTGDGPLYTGRVRIVGPDVFGLDNNGDGYGCDNG